MDEYRRYDFFFAAPCPECGGQLKGGMIFNWPPECGGDPVGDLVRCDGCREEWLNYFYETECDTPPAEIYSDEGGLSIGWSADGYYIFGCEGPIKERTDG